MLCAKVHWLKLHAQIMDEMIGYQGNNLTYTNALYHWTDAAASLVPHLLDISQIKLWAPGVCLMTAIWRL